MISNNQFQHFGAFLNRELTLTHLNTRDRNQLVVKVRKVAKIRNRYNQVPHLTQDTSWESGKNKIKYHKREPRGK